jgi:hypothetical protein
MKLAEHRLIMGVGIKVHSASWPPRTRWINEMARKGAKRGSGLVKVRKGLDLRLNKEDIE